MKHAGRTAEEILLKVTVQANARKESFADKGRSVFSISVKEKAEQNAANHRVRELIANHYGVSVKSVRILTGHTSKNKKIIVVK